MNVKRLLEDAQQEDMVPINTLFQLPIPMKDGSI